MAITTRAQVLAVLELPAAKGALVDLLIPLVEADYRRIRNRPFDTGDTLTITHDATSAGNVTVTVAGNDFAVEVEAGDTVDMVARKVYLRLNALRRYYVSLSGDSVTILVTLGEPLQVFPVGPTVVTVPVGSPVTFTVEATGGFGEPMFQWYYNDGFANTLIAGANDARYTIQSVDWFMNDFYYFCAVSDNLTTLHSPPFTLQVIAAMPTLSMWLLVLLTAVMALGGVLATGRRKRA